MNSFSIIIFFLRNLKCDLSYRIILSRLKAY